MNINVEYCKFYSYNSIQTFCSSGRLVCILRYIASNPPQLLMSRALQKRFVCREVSLVGGDIALFPTPGISKYFFITIVRSISRSTLS